MCGSRIRDYALKPNKYFVSTIRLRSAGYRLVSQQIFLPRISYGLAHFIFKRLLKFANKLSVNK